MSNNETNNIKSKIAQIMTIKLEYSQAITIIIVREINTELNTDNIYISVGNITHDELKSVELYLDDKFIVKDKCIAKYASGILDIENKEELYNSSELKVVINYSNGHTTDAVVTSRPLKEILNSIK